MADVVAGVVVRKIGTVVHIRNVVLRDVFVNLAPRNRDERMDCRLPGLFHVVFDSAHSREPRTPGEVEEHRFGVVVHVVGGGNAVAPPPPAVGRIYHGLYGEAVVI